VLGPALADVFRIVLANITPAALAAAVDTTEATYAIAGLTTNDIIVGVQPPAAQSAHVALVGARVSANGTLALLWGNFTAAANQPVAGVYTLLVARFQ
jgi:hypothetical protein